MLYWIIGAAVMIAYTLGGMIVVDRVVRPRIMRRLADSKNVPAPPPAG